MIHIDATIAKCKLDGVMKQVRRNNRRAANNGAPEQVWLYDAALEAKEVPVVCAIQQPQRNGYVFVGKIAEKDGTAEFIGLLEDFRVDELPGTSGMVLEKNGRLHVVESLEIDALIGADAKSFVVESMNVVNAIHLLLDSTTSFSVTAPSLKAA